MPFEKALKRDRALLDEPLHLGQLVSSSILLIGRSNSNLPAHLGQ
jgi:hypothetical protein